jgi:adenosylhomocysteine nucleosidase
MKIGILGATEEEVHLITKKFENLNIEESAKRKYFSGKLFDIETVLVFSRWGKVASASTVTTLIEKYKIDFLIFIGVSGALNKELNVGDVVIADKLIHHDLNNMSFLQQHKDEENDYSHIPVTRNAVEKTKLSVEKFMTQIHSKISPNTLNQYGITNPKVKIGTIATGNQFISEYQAAELMALNIKNLMCIEMESAAVAQVCHEHNIDFSVIRIISDNFDHSAQINLQQFVHEISIEYTLEIIKDIFETFSQK